MPRDANGFITDRDAERVLAEEANFVKGQLQSLLIADGLDEQAERLNLPGAAGYPGDDELPYVAKLVQGSILVTAMRNREAEIPVIGAAASVLLATETGARRASGTARSLVARSESTRGAGAGRRVGQRMRVQRERK